MKNLPKRRRLFVDRQLQGSMIRHGLLHATIVMVVLCGGIFLPLLWGLDDGAPSSTGLDEASVIMIYLHERFWLVAALCGLLVFVGTLLFSHRIAGPMVRVRRNLGMLRDGELPKPLRTRPRDYFKVEVECLNDAVIGIRERVEAVRVANAELERQLREVMAADPGLGDRLTQVQAAAVELASSIGAFRDSEQSDELPAAEPKTAPILVGQFDG